MEAKTRKQVFSLGFSAGLIAGGIASGVMLLLNVIAGGISLPEVFGSELTALMSPTLFDYLHRTIGGDAKHYLFYGILVGQSLVFAFSGALYRLVADSRIATYARKSARHQATGAISRSLRFNDGLVLAFILWVLTGLLLLPLTGAGIFGAYLSIGSANTMLSLGVVGVTFGLLFVFCYNWLITYLSSPVVTAKRTSRTNESEQTLTRRSFIKRGITVAGVGLVGIGLWRFIVQGGNSAAVPVSRLLQQFKSKIVPPPTPNYGEIQPAPHLSPEITSNDQYYIVSKNLFSDPTVDGGSWRLKIDGFVDHPYTLTYQELLALPTQQQYESMMCISNEVGGQYMSNALWEGIALKALLSRAGVKAGASKVVFYAADDYSDSIHLDKALEATTLLAVRMNGVTLPQGHGFPARMLVPGIYGMKHCKWVTRIEVVNTDYQGYWQQRGWSDPAPVRMTSRIDTPFVGSNVPVQKIAYIAGVAFSGNRGISEVDVSLDAGQTWRRATLKMPLSNLTWVLWEYAWQPTTRGGYTLIVRAIDLEGNVQDPNEESSAPNGSSGYHSIYVSVI